MFLLYISICPLPAMDQITTLRIISEEQKDAVMDMHRELRQRTDI